MKKIVIIAVVILAVCLVSLSFAADMKGTIKSVDAKSGMVMLTVDGKDMHLKADKSVDLGKLKAGESVEATVDNGVLKGVKAAAAAPAAKPKAAVGC